MLDAFVASTALVLTWFLSPDKVASALALIGIWQPVLIAVIIGIATEDAANVKAGAEIYRSDRDLEQAKLYHAEAVELIDPEVPVDEKPQG